MGLVRAVGLSGHGAVMVELGPDGTVAELRRRIKIKMAPVYDAAGERLEPLEACPDEVRVFEPPSGFERLPDEIIAKIMGYLQHYENGAAAASSLILLNRRLYFSAALRDAVTVAKFEIGWGPGSGGGRCRRRVCGKSCDSNLVRVSKLFPHVRKLIVRPPRGVTTPGVLWAKTAATVTARWTNLDYVDLRHVLLLQGHVFEPDTVVPPSAVFGGASQIVASSAVKTACMSLVLLDSIRLALERGSLRSLKLDSVEARPLYNPIEGWPAACLTELELGRSIGELVANSVLNALQYGGAVSMLRRLRLPCGNRITPLPALDRLRLPYLEELSIFEWPCHSIRWRDALRAMLEESSVRLRVLEINCCVLFGCELSRLARAWSGALGALERLDLAGTLISGDDLMLTLNRLQLLKSLAAPTVQRLRSSFPAGLLELSDVRLGESTPPERWDTGSDLRELVQSMLRRCPSLRALEIGAPERSGAELRDVETILRSAKLARAAVSWRGGGVTLFNACD